MPAQSRLAQLAELPAGPDKPERRLYNCLDSYVLPGNTARESKIRVKALRVPTLFPQQRCLSELERPLGIKWKLAQEHRNVAKIHFCKAFEYASGLPELVPFPTVLVMREYEGNILDYIDRFSPTTAQKTRWLLQGAQALRFLHGIGITHGNIYTGNILIDNTGNAVIADVGIYTAIVKYLVPDDVAVKLRFPDSLPFKSASAIQSKGARWAEPTVYDDIFSFAVTCWTVYGGKEPFRMYEETCRTVFRIGNHGHRDLGKVEGMSDHLWKLINSILAQDIQPSGWPSLEDLIVELEAIAG